MAGRHVIRRGDEVQFVIPAGYAELSTGFRRRTLIDDEAGSVHQTFGICELDAGGNVAAHLHSYEESVYALGDGVTCDTPEGSLLLGDGDYGVIPPGMPHAFRNHSDSPVRWVEMSAPQPRRSGGADVWPEETLPEGTTMRVDARDPRTRSWGTITAANMEVASQTQEHLVQSASMRTALLAYSGITVKMMIDSDLGAEMLTMFMVQYEPGGFAGAHDHPFEETFLILDGEVVAVFGGQEYRLGPGDLAWAGVGCVHGFSNPTSKPVRWLETQAPQPPRRHSYRFDRDWTYLTETTRENGHG